MRVQYGYRHVDGIYGGHFSKRLTNHRSTTNLSHQSFSRMDSQYIKAVHENFFQWTAFLRFEKSYHFLSLFITHLTYDDPLLHELTDLMPRQQWPRQYHLEKYDTTLKMYHSNAQGSPVLFCRHILILHTYSRRVY